MKRRFTLTLALLLICSMLLSTAGVLADTGRGVVTSSEEVIYGLMDAAGKPTSAHAVVALNVRSAGEIEHHGEYSGVRNLTNAGELRYEDSTLKAFSEAGRFYYQGEMKCYELPWKVSVKYKLDGKTVSAEELAGAKGKAEIGIFTSANDDAENPGYFEHYLLQISVMLDTELCSNIEAEGATLANAGADKQITFAVLPGEEGENWISADVRDFEMDGVTVAAVPYDVKDAIGDASELTDGLDQLTDGVNSVTLGVRELAIGSQSFSDGLAGFGQGLGALSATSPSLTAGSEQFYAGMGQLAAGMEALRPMSAMDPSVGALLDAFNALYGSYGELNAGIAQYAAGVSALAENWSAIESGAGELAHGAYVLTCGADALNRETQTIPEEVENMLSGGDKEEFVMTSFLSEKNENVAEVQFILKTAAITPAPAEKDVDDTQKENTFLTRLSDLFTEIVDFFKGKGK